jgi:hypothetical protein
VVQIGEVPAGAEVADCDGPRVTQADAGGAARDHLTRAGAAAVADWDNPRVTEGLRPLPQSVRSFVNNGAGLVFVERGDSSQSPGWGSKVWLILEIAISPTQLSRELFGVNREFSTKNREFSHEWRNADFAFLSPAKEPRIVRSPSCA